MWLIYTNCLIKSWNERSRSLTRSLLLLSNFVFNSCLNWFTVSSVFWQVDFDDGNCPTFFNQIKGIHNVYKAVHNMIPSKRMFFLPKFARWQRCMQYKLFLLWMCVIETCTSSLCICHPCHNRRATHFTSSSADDAPTCLEHGWTQHDGTKKPLKILSVLFF